MVWPVKTHPAQSTGPEGKKNSGDGENFSLDFSFYRNFYDNAVYQSSSYRSWSKSFTSIGLSTSERLTKAPTIFWDARGFQTRC